MVRPEEDRLTFRRLPKERRQRRRRRLVSKMAEATLWTTIGLAVGGVLLGGVQGLQSLSLAKSGYVTKGSGGGSGGSSGGSSGGGDAGSDAATGP